MFFIICIPSLDLVSFCITLRSLVCKRLMGRPVLVLKFLNYRTVNIIHSISIKVENLVPEEKQDDAKDFPVQNEEDYKDVVMSGPQGSIPSKVGRVFSKLSKAMMNFHGSKL